jgi:hypothetical protein
MKVCFRPFGVGFEDMDTSEIKEKGAKLYQATKEHVKTGLFISLGLGVVAAEVVTRHTANALTEAANQVADVHAVLAVKRVEFGR